MRNVRLKWDESVYIEPSLPERIQELIRSAPSEVCLGTLVSVVGSSLLRESPNDIDLCLVDSLLDCKSIIRLIEGMLTGLGDRPLHVFQSDTPPHGYSVPMYELVLRRVGNISKQSPSEVVEPGVLIDAHTTIVESLPDEGAFPGVLEPFVPGQRVQIQKFFDKVIMLDCSTGEEVEGYDHIKLGVWSMDRPSIGVWEGIITPGGKCVLRDVLVWEGTPAWKLSVLAREIFLNKTELSEHIDVIRSECVAGYEDLLEAMDRIPKGILRPWLSGGQVAYVVEAANKVLPGNPFRPLKVGSGYHKEEWFAPDDVWKFWMEEKVKQGEAIIAEPKWDGFRITIHKIGKAVRIFTEDANRDRAAVVPKLTDAVRSLPVHTCVLDAECMAFEDGKPVPRIDLASVWGSDKPTNLDVRAFVFDLLYLDGKDLHEQPLRARREALKALLRRSKSPLLILTPQTKPIQSLQELKAIFEKLSQVEGSEGIMLKALDSPYPLTGATGEWAKCKLWKEADYLIIGYREMPVAKPAGVKWTKAEAFESLDAHSGVYTMRVAFAVGEKLQPVESQHRLTERDLKLDWDEDKQQWVGLEDPQYWKMGAGFDHRGPGEFAYGQTYTVKLTEPPQIGTCVAVAASEIDIWEEGGVEHLSWQHPRVRTLKPDKKKPDQLELIKRFARIRSKHKSEQLLREGVGEEGGEGSEKEDTHKVRYSRGSKLKLPFVVQYHSRGLVNPNELAEAARNLDEETWHRYGLMRLTEPYEKVRAAVEDVLRKAGRLSEELEPDWLSSDLAEAAAAPANAAVTKAKSFLSSDYDPDTPLDQIVVIGNCHADLRFMDPSGEFLHGWTMVTSPLAWYSLSGKLYYPIPDALFEGKTEVVHWVCAAKLYQPLAWLTLVSPRQDWWAPPGSPGSTVSTWGHFEYIDSGYLYLGTQKDDYHEYFIVFDKHKDKSGVLEIAKIEARPEYTRIGQAGEWWWTGFMSTNLPYVFRHDREQKEKQAKEEGLTYIYWNVDGAIAALKDKYIGKLPGWSDVPPDKIAQVREIFSANDGRWGR